MNNASVNPNHMDDYKTVSRKKRRKKFNQQNTINVNKIFSNNLFSPLQTNDDDEHDNDTDSMRSEYEKATNQKTTTTPHYKPPPIVITGTCNVNDIMRELKITQYTFKRMSIGYKVMLDNEEEHAKCKTLLIAKKIEFYSHRPRGNKLLKAVLYGLPQTDVNQLKIYFNKNINLKPLDIFEMNTKNKNVHNSLYLFHFDKNDASMSDLRNKIKVINHTLIKWMPYSPKYKGPTQCRNCSMYGHGSENCHRGTICLFCASIEHSSKDCKLSANKAENNDGGNSNPNIIFKCFNCSNKKLPSNHRANDLKCPFRNEYLKLRNTINNRNMQYTQPKIGRAFTPEPHQFPPLSNRIPPQNSFATHTHTYAQQVKLPHTSEDLFTTSELLQIFTGAVTKLKQCTTKLDQITIIASLLEYAI